MLMGLSLGINCIIIKSAMVGKNGSSSARGRGVLLIVEACFFLGAAILSSRLMIIKALSVTAVRIENKQEVIY